MERRTFATIGGIAIVVIGVFLGYKNFYRNVGAPVLFQPEAQMLTQATNPKADLAKTSSSAAFHASLPYAYTKNACGAGVPAAGLCLETFYAALVKKYGVDAAVQDIKRRYGENPAVVAQCHPLMHVIGRTASALYPTISDAYRHGDNFCWSGYYHGILEGVIARIGKKNLPAKLDTICADIPGKATYNFDYYNCVHGLGHGIMEALGDEVFQSLAMCDNLTGDWERQSCYSGVFMENIIAYDRDGISDFLKPSDPLYPCDAVAEPYKAQCYLGQTSYVLQISNYNFKTIFNLCAGAVEPYRDICNQSAGRDAANQALHDTEKTKATCSFPVDPNDRANCVTGAVKEIISYYHSEDQAKQFCGALNYNDQSECLATADSYYTAFR